MTKLSSSLPKEYDEDGLGSINYELVARPTDTGIDIATARILHIEPLREHEAEQAREMLSNAQERRTGKRAIPGIVDGKTGEVLRDGNSISIVRGGQA